MRTPTPACRRRFSACPEKACHRKSALADLRIILWSDCQEQNQASNNRRAAKRYDHNGIVKFLVVVHGLLTREQRKSFRARVNVP